MMRAGLAILAERLESERDPIEPSSVAAELRRLLADCSAADRAQPTEQALYELGLWAARFEGRVDDQALIAALLTEAALRSLEAGHETAAWVGACRVAWRAIRQAVMGMTEPCPAGCAVCGEPKQDSSPVAPAGCGEGGCGSCDPAG